MTGRDDDLLALYERTERWEARPPGVRREETPHAVRHVSLVDDQHYVIASRLDAATADDVIAREIDHFRTHHGGAFEWKWFAHDRPPDLLERLRRQGFAIGEEEALMVRSTVEPVPGAAAADVVVRRLSAGELAPLEAVVAEVWPEHAPQIVERMARALGERPHHVHAYVAEQDGRAVSAAWTDFLEGSPFAGLRGGGTLPAYRGRGAYRALVARRLVDAAARGVPFAAVDAGPMSRPILERLGFRVVTTTIPCTFGRP